MKKMILLCAAALLTFGCRKEKCGCAPPPGGDFEYFIFGTAYGECAGDCARIYKLQGSQLFADDGLEYLTSAQVNFQSNALSSDKVALATALWEKFPNDLLDQPSGNIGCPDCRDQGTAFIKVRQGGQDFYWMIDPDEVRYKEFTTAVRETVVQLN